MSLLKRSSNTKQFPSSKHASSSTKFWKPTLSTTYLTMPRYSSGRKIGPLCGTMVRIKNNKWVLRIVRDGFRIPFRPTPPLLSVPISLSQSSSPLLREEITDHLQKRAEERVQDPGTSSFLFLVISCPKKEWKVLSSNRSFSAKSKHKETTIQDGDSQVSMTIDIGQRLDCLYRPDRCLPTCSDSPSIQKVSSVHVWRSGLQFTALPFGMSLSVDFHQTNGGNSSALASMCHLVISVPR